jgi:hypothetical protein
MAWKYWLVWVAVASAGMVSSARAQTCASDADCAHGFSCEVTGGSTCAAARPCAMGESCPPPPACDPVVFRECRPGPCTHDADCAEDMICFSERSETCSVAPIAPCAPGASCPPPRPPVCETHVRQSCAPRYVLPCEADSDCGAGFSCSVTAPCNCASPGTAPAAPVPMADAGTPEPATPVPAADAGSAEAPAPAVDAGSSGAAFRPAPPQDGGQADRAPEGGGAAPPAQDGGTAARDAGPSCVCPDSPVRYCALNEIECAHDSDCPERFTCQTSGGGADPVPACDPQPGSDASACGQAPAPRDEVRRCLPPYYGAFDHGGVGVSRGEMPAAPSGGRPTTSPLPADGAIDAGVEEDAAEEPEHVEACSVRQPGGARGPAGTAAFALGFAAALYWRRRRAASRSRA